MESKNMIGGIVSLAVVVICVATIMMPVLSDAMETAGKEVTLTNSTAVVLREVEDGDVLKCVRTVVTAGSEYSDVWTLNDEEIEATETMTASYTLGIVSDGLYMQIFAEANTNSGIAYKMDGLTPYYFNKSAQLGVGETSTSTFTFEDGTITAELIQSGVTTTLTTDYTWGYIACPDADGKYCAAVSGGSGYVSKDDVVVLGGAYTSGALDTMYYYKDGVNYVSDADYTMTTNISTALTDGYTDIYTATVSVSITDGTDTETFTPYRILLPYEVTGHEASGAAYSLYAAIPVIVIAGIVLASIGMVVTKRD